MWLQPCIECRRQVPLQNRDLGPWAALALLPPLRVLCVDCVAALALDVRQEGGLPFVILRGEEFRQLADQFTPSDHPQNRHAYHRDTKAGGDE